MRNRFDHLAKQLGQRALAPSGPTIAHDEITPEIQYADLRHEPHPARQAERDRLGLLGRLASCACLIEVYSAAPGAEEFRACLGKHLASWQARARTARTDHKRRAAPLPREGVAAPFLWIISAGAPTTLLTELALAAPAGWPAGVYLFGANVLRVGLVVASELPRDSTTLLVRLMAAGPLLAQAAREVAALPPDAHLRAVAEPALLHLHHVLGEDPSRTTDEQEFIMVMLKTWEETRTEGRAEGRTEGRAEGRTEGRAEGRTEAMAAAILTALRVRGIALPDATRERILAERDVAILERWLEKSIVAASIGEVIDEPS